MPWFCVGFRGLRPELVHCWDEDLVQANVFVACAFLGSSIIRDGSTCCRGFTWRRPGPRASVIAHTLSEAAAAIPAIPAIPAVSPVPTTTTTTGSLGHGSLGVWKKNQLPGCLYGEGYPTLVLSTVSGNPPGAD